MAKYNRRDDNRKRGIKQIDRHEGAENKRLGFAKLEMSHASQLVATCPVTGRQRTLVSRDRALDTNFIQKSNPIRARGFDLVHNDEGYNLRVERAKREQRSELRAQIAAITKASQA